MLAQEKTRPYLPVVFKMPPEWIDCGRGLYRAQLKVAAECMRTGVWPGPVVGERALVLPAWAYPKEDDDTEQEISRYERKAKELIGAIQNGARK